MHGQNSETRVRSSQALRDDGRWLAAVAVLALNDHFFKGAGILSRGVPRRIGALDSARLLRRHMAAMLKNRQSHTGQR